MEDDQSPLKVRKLQASKATVMQQKSIKKEEPSKVFKKEIKIGTLGKDLQNLDSPARHLNNNDSLKLLRNDSQIPLQSFLRGENMGNHERGLSPEKEATKDLVEDQLNFGEEAIKSLLESSIMQHQDDIVKIDQSDEHTSQKQHRETSRTTVTAPWPNDLSPQGMNVPFKNNQIISKIMHEEAMKQTRSVAFDDTSGNIKVDNSTSSLEESFEDNKRSTKNSKQTL